MSVLERQPPRHSGWPAWYLTDDPYWIPEGVPVVVMPDGGRIPIRDHVVGYRVMRFTDESRTRIADLGLRNVSYHEPEWWRLDADGRRVQGADRRAQVVGLVPFAWGESE